MRAQNNTHTQAQSTHRITQNANFIRDEKIRLNFPNSDILKREKRSRVETLTHLTTNTHI